MNRSTIRTLLLSPEDISHIEIYENLKLIDDYKLNESTGDYEKKNKFSPFDYNIAKSEISDSYLHAYCLIDGKLHYKNEFCVYLKSKQDPLTLYTKDMGDATLLASMISHCKEENQPFLTFTNE